MLSAQLIDHLDAIARGIIVAVVLVAIILPAMICLVLVIWLKALVHSKLVLHCYIVSTDCVLVLWRSVEKVSSNLHHVVAAGAGLP